MTQALEVHELRKSFPMRQGLFGRTAGHVHAVQDVSFAIEEGETLSLVGESGCGKSTVGRLILRLLAPDHGAVTLEGQRMDTAPPETLRGLRRRVQMIFQDPFSSLSPRMLVRDIIAEPLRNFGLAHGREIDDRVAELLEQVRLPVDAMYRRAHEFSGGQRQRIGIARALAPRPSVIVCDEAVSALDVSVKAQIVNLLVDLQAELGISLLFISHDLAVVEQMSHRVAVMYLGRIVEIGRAADVFGGAAHPYTAALLSAVPVPEPDDTRQRIVLQGDVPSPINPPPGCAFHTRCPYAFARCRTEQPALRARPGTGHLAACHLDTMPAQEEAIQ